MIAFGDVGRCLGRANVRPGFVQLPLASYTLTVAGFVNPPVRLMPTFHPHVTYRNVLQRTARTVTQRKAQRKKIGTYVKSSRSCRRTTVYGTWKEVTNMRRKKKLLLSLLLLKRVRERRRRRHRFLRLRYVT